jgi:hypothetical protein
LTGQFVSSSKVPKGERVVLLGHSLTVTMLEDAKYIEEFTGE